MSYYLGIDGGGTKTLCLLADETGRLLGRGTAGTSNYHIAGLEAATGALEESIASAFAGAGLRLQPARRLTIGLSGVDRPEDRIAFERWAAERKPADSTRIVNDAEIVLAAGTPDGWGVAIICGTGSIAYGRDAYGRQARAGGWGHILGDEGSGYDIGAAALRAVARATDGRAPATALTGPVLAHWSLRAPPDLIARVYQRGATPAEIAGLAELVDRAATGGDRVALSIVRQAGRELALAAAAVIDKLGLTGPVPCAEAGGVITHSAQVDAAFQDAARERGLSLTPVSPVTEPAYGALRLALRAGPS